MFDKLNQIRKIREVQKQLAKERSEIEKEGTKVAINGNLQIEEISLNPELDKEKQEEILKECLNEAVKEMQQKMAQSLGGLM
jgi:DNA-binding protein YbaB